MTDTKTLEELCACLEPAFKKSGFDGPFVTEYPHNHVTLLHYTDISTGEKGLVCAQEDTEGEDTNYQLYLQAKEFIETGEVSLVDVVSTIRTRF